MSAIDLLWALPVMALLLALKGFFSGSEIALVSADRIRLGRAAKGGDRGARMVLDLFRRPERVLTTTLIGTNLATVSLTTLGTLLVIHFVGPGRGDLVAFVVYTPVFLILGEIVPKAIFQEKADVIAPIVARPLRWLAVLLAPAVLLFSVVARAVARRVGGPPSTQGLFVARDQLRAMLEMADRDGGQTAFDRARLERAIRFPATTVGQRMVPVAEMVAVDRATSLGELRRLLLRHGHVQMPVFEGNVSNIVGVAVVEPWALAAGEGDDTGGIDELIRSVLYVPPSETLETLAPTLVERGERMAIVVDEYGSAIGLVTTSDLYESVVGDVHMGLAFEEQVGRRGGRYERLDDGSYRMDARLPISELNDLLETDIPLGDFHTVGGLVTSQIHHLAMPGESVIVAGHRFVVEEASDRAIRAVRVERVGPAAA